MGLKIKNIQPSMLNSKYLIASENNNEWVFKSSADSFLDALQLAKDLDGIVLPVSEVEIETEAPDKIYFSEYRDGDAFFHIYDKTVKIVEDVVDDYCGQGYEECLKTFGFQYFGNFVDEKKYLKTIAQTKQKTEHEREN